MDKVKKLTSTLTNKLANVSDSKKKMFVLWFVITILFIGAAAFVYINYIEPRFASMAYKANYEFDSTVENKLDDKNSGYINTSGKAVHPDDTIGEDTGGNQSGGKDTDVNQPPKKGLPTFYLFWACWCPNSNKQSTRGKKLHELYDVIKTKFNGKVNFIRTMEGDDDFVTHEKLVTKGSEIEGFPSIYMVYDDNGEKVSVEFDAFPTEEAITEFINDNK